ncbi:MAG: glutathione-disulfide reductase [Stagnimonas sp.]|nr:glutathione-disulfide reductase [Stagnimonas sp.]
MSAEFDLFVIGAGSGGVRAARFAAGFGARVAIAESRYLGGTCVNVGCVPKKLLVYGSHYREEFEQAAGYGWTVDGARFDWARLIAGKNREIARLNEAYRRLLLEAGVQLLEGHARILDAHTVELGGARYRTKQLLIATGSWPQRPEIPGAELGITSNEAFFLPALPPRVLVVGGGYIAVEFAGIFRGCGAQVCLLHRGEQLLRGFDSGLREQLALELRQRGIALEFGVQPQGIERRPDGSLATTLADGRVLASDCVLFATGRRPMLDGLGLEQLPLARDARGYLAVDAGYQTSVPGVHALGDVIGRVPLTPVALAEGMALARRLFRPQEFQPVDYQGIPTAVFSQPSLATVGLSEEAARAAGHRLKIFESRFRPMKLSLTESPERSYMKLVVDADSDRVLGCHLLGPEAGEIMQGLAVALTAGASKRQFDQTLGIHPTLAEEFVSLRAPVRTDS